MRHVARLDVVNRIYSVYHQTIDSGFFFRYRSDQPCEHRLKLNFKRQPLDLAVPVLMHNNEQQV
jgi:hypothetical protein